MLPTESLNEYYRWKQLIRPKYVWERKNNVSEFICENVPDDVLVASPHSCRHYYRCKDSVATGEICEDGYVFDEDNQKCVAGNEADCVLCPKTGFLLLRDPQNCKNFYRCKKGRRFKYGCPAGKYFDVTTLMCKPRGEARCFTSDLCLQHNATEASAFAVADPNDCQK